MTIKRVPIQVPISGVTPEQLTVTAQNSEEARRAITNIQERFKDDAALVWDDLRADIRQGDAQAALTYERIRNTGTFIVGHMRHDQADTLYFTYQMPHRWAKTAVHPHIHFVPCASMVSEPSTLTLDVVWSWVPYNEEVQELSDYRWNTETATARIYNANVFRHRIISLGVFEPVRSCRESSVLLIKVSRNTTATNPYDASKTYATPAANVALLSSDVHFQVEKGGTKEEYPK